MTICDHRNIADVYAPEDILTDKATNTHTVKKDAKPIRKECQDCGRTTWEAPKPQSAGEGA